MPSIHKLPTVLTIVLLLAPALASAEFLFVEDLTPVEGQFEDFGMGAELFDNELFVSWPHGYGNPAPALQCGEVHYYNKNSEGRFELISVLKAPTCIPGDMFGATSIALAGDTLVIPAFAGLRSDGQGNPADSRVWVFERDPDYNSGDFNAGWRPVTDLVGSNVGGNRAMGGGVQLVGDTLAVQSQVFESIFGFSFARTDGIYIFQRDDDQWHEIARVSEATDFFGLGFRLTADQLVVGAPEAQTFGGAGRLFVYDRDGDDFVLAQTLTAGPEANFGYFVDVQGDRMAASAINIAAPGALFLYRRDNDGLWQADGKLVPPVRNNNDLYGISARFVDDLLIVGAENGLRQSEPAAGKVFVYQLEEDDYVLIQELVAPVASSASDVFGGYVTSNGADLIVKAFGSPAGGQAALYHFQREVDESFTISLGHSGLFYDPDRAGEGFVVDTLPDGRGLMYWFTYHDGEPMWLLAIGPIEGNVMMLNEVFVTDGARFGADFDPADVNLINWGSMVFEFDDCDNGRAHYVSDIGFGEGTLALTRLSNIAGIRCGETEGLVANGFSGGFFNPDRAGEGLQVHITDLNGERVPVVYFGTYDTQGNQLWLFGMGHTEGDSIIIDSVLRFSGAEFGDLFNSADVVDEHWGTMVIDYDGCDDLTLQYDSTDPDYGAGSLELTRLYFLGQTTCLEDSPSLH